MILSMFKDMSGNLWGAYYAMGAHKHTGTTAVHWEAKEFKAPLP